MYSVEGYEFESMEIAEKAKKEANAIKYIKSQTKMDNPDVVLQLYNKLLQKKMFETPVGMAFLDELQEYLRTIPYIKNEDIRPIAVLETKTKKKKPVRQQPAISENALIKKYKKKYHFTLFLSIVFGAIIISMFAIMYISGNNTTILNYENAIIDKYESWEAELESREAELNKREAANEQN